MCSVVSPGVIVELKKKGHAGYLLRRRNRRTRGSHLGLLSRLPGVIVELKKMATLGTSSGVVIVVDEAPTKDC